MPRPLFAVSLFTALLVASPLRAGSEMAQIVRIVDGNTFIASLREKEVTVRLIGVVTPEPTHKRVEVSEFGKTAALFLEKLIPKSKWVFLEYEPNRARIDKEGRILAYAYRHDGVFVNERILAEGFGVAHTKQPFRYAEDFTTIQQKAQFARKGLWGNGADEATMKQGVSPVSTQAAYLGRGVDKGYNGYGWVTVWIYEWW